MGRAYEVRKASIQKNGAAKAKLYSTFAKEIYLAAKTAGVDPNANQVLKRLMERAKASQVPNDIITRAIDKVNKGITEDYTAVLYEGFGPDGANIIVKGLTDNVNRMLSYIRPAFTRNSFKIGAVGSVTYMYDYLSIVSVKGISEEVCLEVMINNEIDVVNIEKEDEVITIYGSHNDLYRIKQALEDYNKSITFELEEITYLPKEEVCLTGESREEFDKLIKALDEIEDVTDYYHNVKED